MSQHFVTVCVVCVLCAANTPCSAHTELTTLHSSSPQKTGILQNSPGPGDQLQPHARLVPLRETRRNIRPNPPETPAPGTALPEEHGRSFVRTIHQHRSGRLKRENRRLREVDWHPTQDSQRRNQLAEEEALEGVSIVKQRDVSERLGNFEAERSLQGLFGSSWRGDGKGRSRGKREAKIDEKYFLKELFKAYGDGESMTMEGFERMARKLGLWRSEEDVNKQEEYSNQAGSRNGDTKEGDSNTEVQNKDTSPKQKCLSSNELLTSLSGDASYQSTTNSTLLPGWLFERVCPALVYQLTNDPSPGRSSCIREPEALISSTPHEQNTLHVWIYSTISIVVISLCGLLGVVVIPVMGKSYYHQLLQFLVALAVGTLCGDALIHLLPHAMMSSEAHDNHNGHEHGVAGPPVDFDAQHKSNMLKGLVAMMGLVLFFFTEKALTMIAEWRKQRQRLNKLPPRVRVMREPDGPSVNAVGEKLCKHKYSSYPYCYGEITTETQDNHHNRNHNDHQRPAVVEEEKPLTSNCNSVSKAMENNVDKKQEEDWKKDEKYIPATKITSEGDDVLVNEPESYTVIIREHETKHHGHTHSHGHVHSAPESMSSVAWMVVMGDGLHNFTDGMAIGAAFSANIAGGFSTAIAVFCHELPHELGDFAVLLKAGMSAKQAVFYNMLSSVLCLFGMIFGVLVGATPAATSWIFAAAAGMFIYIALVDMIPELTSSHSAEGGSQWQCILQALGLATGLGIMLTIALFEHDLQHIFND